MSESLRRVRCTTGGLHPGFCAQSGPSGDQGRRATRVGAVHPGQPGHPRAVMAGGRGPRPPVSGSRAPGTCMSPPSSAMATMALSPPRPAAPGRKPPCPAWPRGWLRVGRGGPPDADVRQCSVGAERQRPRGDGGLAAGRQQPQRERPRHTGRDAVAPVRPGRPARPLHRLVMASMAVLSGVGSIDLRARGLYHLLVPLARSLAHERPEPGVVGTGSAMRVAKRVWSLGPSGPR